MQTKFVFGVLLSCLFLSLYSVNAQGKRDSGALLFLGGASIVDDSFTTDYNPLAISDRWNYGYYLGTEMNLSSDFSLQLMYTNNFFTSGTIVDGSSIDNDYTSQSLSLNASLNFQNMLRLKRSFDPYVLVGLGAQFVESEQNEILNFAAGTRYWFSSHRYGRNYHDFAIDFRVGGIWILPRNDSGRLVMATIGISYRLSK